MDKYKDRLEYMQTDKQEGKQAGHVAEHRVHLWFNLCCVSWVRTRKALTCREFREGTQL